jgi:hypothetical protein
MQDNLPPEYMGQDDGLVVVVSREITAHAVNVNPAVRSQAGYFGYSEP